MGFFLKWILLPTILTVLQTAAMATDDGEHQHHPGLSAEVNKFYTGWKMPENRAKSCCNLTDCYPATFRFEDGRWFAERREDKKWMLIEQKKFEDDRDSPDGRNHVCMQKPGFADEVFCAILGSGM